MPTRSDAMPAAEHAIDAALARALLAEQHPELAGLPLRELANGWDNVIFRLGEAHVVRLPRRAAAADLIRNEQRWLPTLAPGLPLPIPVPARVGRPGRGYPWYWSVCPWYPGEVAASAPPSDRTGAARSIGGFLAALHRPAPADAPNNPLRGGPLAERVPDFEARIERMGAALDAHAVRAAWCAALDAPAWEGPPCWLHGDLHPANLVVRAGRIAAVIDFGDITAGDPATDLAVAWTLLDAGTRPLLRTAYGGVDAATWRRARGWALHFALAYLAHSAEDPVMHAVGERALAEVLRERGRW